MKDILILFIAGLRGKEIVNHLHGADFKPFFCSLGPAYKWILSRAYHYVTRAIVLTPGMVSQFDMFPSMQVVVVPNCFDKALLEIPLKKKPDNILKFLFLSNLLKSKGILVLLDAFELILAKYSKGVQLMIAGQFMSDSLASKSQITDAFYSKFSKLDAKYPGKVIYLGAIGPEQKVVALSESDVLVLPTFYPTEAFPLSILEGMASGLFIISTNHNYIPEIVKKENGDLVEPDNVKLLAASIENVLIDATRVAIVKLNNYQLARTLYSEHIFINKIKEVLCRH